MLNFEWKIKKCLKCLNLRAKLGIDQSVEIWMENVNKWKSRNWSKGSNLSEKVEINQMLKFVWKVRHWSECWNEDKVENPAKFCIVCAKCQINQNMEIWVKK